MCPFGVPIFYVGEDEQDSQDEIMTAQVTYRNPAQKRMYVVLYPS